ncbi:MAG: MFS transporter, partial [Planctomycetota bacterium]|nr:MFS transporter [Planctomycetota bacterium]
YAWAQPCLGELGITEPAWKMTWGQMSETAFLFIMPVLFIRLGFKKMLLIGMLAWTVRYGLFSYGAPETVFWMLASGIILHGICYDFFFVTGQIYVDKMARKEIRGAAQGLLVFVTLGLGLGIGSKVSGWIVDYYKDPVTGNHDWQTIWMWPAGMAAVVLVIFGLLFRDPPKEEAAQQDDPGGAEKTGSGDGDIPSLYDQREEAPE